MQTTTKRISRQFRIVLTGIATKGDFREQTGILIMDAFIQNKNNKAVRERLYTEQKEGPQETYLQLSLRKVSANNEVLGEKRTLKQNKHSQ